MALAYLSPAQLGGDTGTSAPPCCCGRQLWAGDKHWGHMLRALGNSRDSRNQAVQAGGKGWGAVQERISIL